MRAFEARVNRDDDNGDSEDTFEFVSENVCIAGLALML